MKFREIFVFVLGKTPQVVTETLYCLMRSDPPVFPDEIHILTTAEGERLMREGLLQEGHLAGLFRHYGYEPFATERLNVVVFTDGNGRPLQDIRTTEDNECVGDFITSFIERLSRRRDVRLHCSLAGGRKTMGFYLGMALSLFGRPWDKLYHVLVQPELESRPDFYYPVPGSTYIDAVQLAELPFVRLREKVTLTGRSFKGLVADGQKALDLATFQRKVQLEIAQGRLIIADREVSLPPVQLALYRLLLLYKTQGCSRPERPYCGDCTDCFLSLAELSGPEPYRKMLEGLSAFYGPRSGQLERFRTKWEPLGGVSQEVLLQYISKINRALKEEGLEAFYTISAVGRPRQRRYGLMVDRSLIEVR